LNENTPARRTCGECTACCTLVPVAGLNKAAHQRCKYSRAFKGCVVHHQPEKGFPFECGVWSCVWLASHEDLPRPDRGHMVVDIVMDNITVNNEGGESQIVPVVQVWMDKDHREAHREPRFRAWLVKVGYPAIIRYDEKEAMILFPPALTITGEWVEFAGSKLQMVAHETI
jgi:hypothetical protein